MNVTKLVFLILLFFVIANPITFKYVNKGLSYVGLKGIIYDSYNDVLDFDVAGIASSAWEKGASSLVPCLCG